MFLLSPRVSIAILGSTSGSEPSFNSDSRPLGGTGHERICCSEIGRAAFYHLVYSVGQIPATGKYASHIWERSTRVPGIEPGPNGVAGAEVLQLVGTPWHITKANFYTGDAASLELYPSK